MISIFNFDSNNSLICNPNETKYIKSKISMRKIKINKWIINWTFDRRQIYLDYHNMPSEASRWPIIGRLEIQAH